MERDTTRHHKGCCCVSQVMDTAMAYPRQFTGTLKLAENVVLGNAKDLFLWLTPRFRFQPLQEFPQGLIYWKSADHGLSSARRVFCGQDSHLTAPQVHITPSQREDLTEPS